MDDFGAGGYGGEAPRDFFSQVDPFSPLHSSGQDDVGCRPGSRFSGGRIDFDGIDLNSQSAAFPHVEEYEGFLEGAGAPAGGSDPRGHGGSGARSAFPPHPTRSGPPGMLPSRGRRGAAPDSGLRRGGRRGGHGAPSTSRPSGSGKGKAIATEENVPDYNQVRNCNTTHYNYDFVPDSYACAFVIVATT